MAEHLLWQRLAKGHEQYGPDYRMKAYDLLAYQMNVGRPVFSVQAVVARIEAQLCDIV